MTNKVFTKSPETSMSNKVCAWEPEMSLDNKLFTREPETCRNIKVFAGEAKGAVPSGAAVAARSRQGHDEREGHDDEQQVDEQRAGPGDPTHGLPSRAHTDASGHGCSVPLPHVVRNARRGALISSAMCENGIDIYVLFRICEHRVPLHGYVSSVVYGQDATRTGRGRGASDDR